MSHYTIGNEFGTCYMSEAYPHFRSEKSGCVNEVTPFSRNVIPVRPDYTR